MPLTWGVLWLPVLLLPLLLTAFGLALGLSAVGVFWRDIMQITQFCVLALMFASAVLYPVSQISAPVWAIMKFNPLLLVFQEARGTVFWGLPLNYSHVCYLYAFALAACFFGAVLSNAHRSSFADVL